MKIIRTFTSIAGVITLTLMLSACSENQPENQQKSTQSISDDEPSVGSTDVELDQGLEGDPLSTQKTQDSLMESLGKLSKDKSDRADQGFVEGLEKQTEADRLEFIDETLEQETSEAETDAQRAAEELERMKKIENAPID